MPSKESTDGCYRPRSGKRQPEIWITSDLVKTGMGFYSLLGRFIRGDRLFETLFHELGHHKASLVHSVDKFEGEAFAEKYMLAYKPLWEKHRLPGQRMGENSRTSLADNRNHSGRCRKFSPSTARLFLKSFSSMASMLAVKS